MQYRYAPAEPQEDLAAGRVLFHRGGMPCFPVRPGYEIFCRCAEAVSAAVPAESRQAGLTLYDPCCGGGYLLTVLGFLGRERIARIFGSDIDGDALSLARDNLALLTPAGRARRRAQLEEMANRFGKASHAEALQSLERLERRFPGDGPAFRLFRADILSPDGLASAGFTADIVIADVPYGRMTDWQGGPPADADRTAGDEDASGPLGRFLRALVPVCAPETVIAVITDKGQRLPRSITLSSPLSGDGKAANPRAMACPDEQKSRLIVEIIEKFTIGKRRAAIFRLLPAAQAGNMPGAENTGR